MEALIHKGKSATLSQTQACIILKAATGVQDKDIIQALEVYPSMVAKTRQRCVEEGPEAALKDRPCPGQAPKQTDKQAAHLMLGYAASCSYELIRRLLKKHSKTLAEAGLEYSGRQCGIRGGHGRRP